MASPLEGISNLSPQFQEAYKKSLEVDARPIRLLEERQKFAQEKVGLLSDVIGRVEKIGSLLGGLDTPLSLVELTLTSSQEKVITGTVDKQLAKPGTYNIQVDQLATGSNAMSVGFPDRNETQAGSGYFDFELPDGTTQSVYVDAENSTLDGMAAAINQSNIGVRASVVNDVSDPENPFKLVLSKEGTGAANSVIYPMMYFVDGDEDFFLDRENPATNARVRYDGMDIETGSNTIEDLIPGVSLNLHGVSDFPAQIKIEKDVPAVGSKIKGLVEGLNSVFSFIQEQNAVDENTPTQKTLGNDYVLKLTDNKLKEAMRSFTNLLSTKNIRSMADLGIMFNREGTLEINEKKLEDTINTHYDEVVELFTGTEEMTGLAARLREAIDGLTKGNGTLSNQKKTINDKIRNLQRDIGTKEARMEKKADRMKADLMKAQEAISAMQGQIAGITGSINFGGLK